MKNKFIIIFLCIFSIELSAAEINNLESKIFKNLRCIVCQGQSIAESNSDFAQTIKIVVRDKIDQGDNEKEFLDDMKRFKYIKRLLRKYQDNGPLKERLILNHIIVLNNVFGADACSTLLLFKLETSLWKYIKPFMELLNILPEGELKDIKNDEKVESILRDI